MFGTRERIDRDQRARGDCRVAARGGIFLYDGSKGTETGNTDEQVAREPFCEETERQRPSNWHSEMHFDSASAQIQSPGAIWKWKRKEVVLHIRYNAVYHNFNMNLV